MNLGKGFMIPQENGVVYNGVPWIPATPEKPAMGMLNPVVPEIQGSLTNGTNWQEQLRIRSQFTPEMPVTQTPYHPIACEMQGDQVEGNNWSELLGIYRGFLQETPKDEALYNFNGAGLQGHVERNMQDTSIRTNGFFNQNSGPYMQNISNDIPVRGDNSSIELLGIKNAPPPFPINGIPTRSSHGSDKFSFTSSYPPIENKWTNYQPCSSMLPHQKNSLQSNPGSASSSLQKMPSDGILVPYPPLYNLNSPPREETAAPSSATSCFQFTPVTPDQGNLRFHQQSQIHNFSVDESLLQGNDKREIISASTEAESYSNELLHSVISAPSATNSTVLKENGIAEDKDHGGIDLNKTPQQRPSRRKKVRPKVVVEGKPKRTPKRTPTPIASKAKTSSENPSGKRKYVRRKGTYASNSGTENGSNVVDASGVNFPAKSCRRVLNFDLENKSHVQSENCTGDNQEDALIKSKPFDLNLACQEKALSVEFDPVSGASEKEREPNVQNPENLQEEGTSYLLPNNQVAAEISLLLFPEASSPAVKDHTLNVIARSLNLQNAAGPNIEPPGRSQGHQHIVTHGMGQRVLQDNTVAAKFDAARQLMLQTLATSLNDPINEIRESKREYCQISETTYSHSQSVQPMHSQFLSRELPKICRQKTNSSKNGTCNPGAHKRKKLENECHGFASAISSSVKSVQEYSKQVESRCSNYIHTCCSLSCQFGRLPNIDLEMQKTVKEQNSGCNGIASDKCNTNTTAVNGFPGQESSSSVCLRLLNIRPVFQEKTTSTTTDCLLYPTQGVPRIPGNESAVKFSEEKQAGVIASSIQAFRKGNMYPEENKKERGSRRSSRKAKAQKEGQSYAAAVEEITHLLKGLKINNSDNDVVGKEQNAIVPYRADGAIVTYEDPMKRRKPRPKVDLDAETSRVWNLLMGKAGSEESTEPGDMEKEKWWANERAVVRGRVDSFIARMHLVQGDRRFSQWKGSVVDSVIGVFLTQNVSDHLSSSAFMSLAAKFPQSLPTFNENWGRNGAIAWIEEPEVQIIDPDGTITYHGRMFSQPEYKLNCTTLSESSERRSENIVSETASPLANDNSSGAEEEVVSSQNSSNSFLQAIEDIRSSSESENEDSKLRCNSNYKCSSGNLRETERASEFNQYQSHGTRNLFLNRSTMYVYQQQESPVCIKQYSRLDGREAHANTVISDVLCHQGSFSSSSGSWLNKSSVGGVHAHCSFGSLEQKSMSSFLHKSIEIVNSEGPAQLSKKMGGTEGSTNSSTIQTGSVANHAIAMDRIVYQNKQQKNDLQPESHFLSSQHSSNSKHVEASKSFELEGRSIVEPMRHKEADAERQTGHLGSSSKVPGSIGTKSPNARKKKPELEKPKSFDWDSLRKKVFSKKHGGVHAHCSFGSLEQKSMSSFLHKSIEIVNSEGPAQLSKKMGGTEGSTNSSTIQTGSVANHAIAMDRIVYQNKQQKNDLQPESHFLSSQHSSNSKHVEASKSFELEGRSIVEPMRHKEADAERQTGHLGSSSKVPGSIGTKSPNARKKKPELEKPKSFDWDSLRKKVFSKGGQKERNKENMDSLDYEALRHADVKTISDTIKERGMNNMLAERIKDFLDRLVTDHGSIDLEWLRDVPADQAKDYLLSIRGLGLKSVECVRLLTLHQIAFPVDTNVGRIAVRLGWVPLQPLPESLQLHLLELYPILESIQKYLWPRLCKLDQRTLYELHYQMITFGKVFCTKTKPNCNACPLRPECRHFASAFASARLALPAPEGRSIISSATSIANPNASILVKPVLLPPTESSDVLESQYIRGNCEPIIEEPTTPEPYSEVLESDIEDMFYEDPAEIPTIKLSFEELKMNVESILQEQNMELQPGDLSRALVALDPSATSIPAPKLKSVTRLRTEHQVYELPDSHPLLEGMDRRERDDPSPYLLAIWSPGETENSTQSPASPCSLQGSGRVCNASSQTVRGTILIPCRTAMRGSFPLNGTYFQVNEMFADHESSINPIDVPRDGLWQLPRRTVYFGTSVTSIFRGLTTPVIQQCFWKGFVCVRGFDRKSRAPRPLQPRLHVTASRINKNKTQAK